MKKKLLFLLLPSLILAGCAKGSSGGDTPGGGGDTPGGGGDEPGGGGEPVDTKVTVNFYLDFNNIETPYETQKVENGSKLTEPLKPTKGQAPDPANNVFIGWSKKEVIDLESDLWNFETDTLDTTLTTFNLFGIWDAAELSYSIQINEGEPVELTENKQAVLVEGQTGQYEVDLSNLKENDTVKFLAYDKEITIDISSEPETLVDKNLISGKAGAYYIHNDVECSHITFKTWTKGVTFWATGFVSNGNYLIGSFSDWKHDAQYNLSVNPDNPNEYMIKEVALTANDTLKLVVDDVYYGSESLKSGVTVAEGDGTSEKNIIIKSTGSFDFYFNINRESDFGIWIQEHVNPVDEQDKTFYLDPGVWETANAWYAIYAFGSIGSEWVKMSKSGTYYAADVDIANYTSIIFCRMNPASQQTSWENKWNQSEDLNTNDGNLYTITSWGSEKSPGTWSTIN